MDWKEAYRRVKKEHPNLMSKAWTLFRNRFYVFIMEPNEGYPPGEVVFGFPCFAFDTKAGKVVPFNYRRYDGEDTYDEFGKSPFGLFDEKDVL